VGVVAKHGWEIDMGYKGLCRLINRGRFGHTDL
jgi:hypothetical protein